MRVASLPCTAWRRAVMVYSGMSPLRLDGIRHEKNRLLVLRRAGELPVRQPGADFDGVAVRVFDPKLMQRGFLATRPRRLHDGYTNAVGPIKKADHGQFVADINAEMIDGVVLQRLAIRDQQNEVEMKILTVECGRSIRPPLGPGRYKPGMEPSAAR